MKQRVISALIAAIIVIPLIIIGGLPFKIGVILIGILGLRELLELFKEETPKSILIGAYLSEILLIIGSGDFLSFEKSLSLITIVAFVMLIFLDKKTYNFNNLAKIYTSVIFLGFVFNKLCEIRLNDIYLFLFILIIPMLTDIFAYVVGSSSLGKTKLLPKISPKKTVEGSLAGTIIAAVAASIFYIFMIDPAANIFLVIIMVVILSVAGQIGDLVFSSIKRYYDVKDFSNIMPGHGGILDRIDSTIFVLLVVYLLLI